MSQQIIQLKQDAFQRNSYNARFIEGKYDKLYPGYRESHHENNSKYDWEKYWEIRQLLRKDKNKITDAPSTCILHRMPESGELCEKCKWLRFKFAFVKQQAGIRYQQRQAPFFMYENLYRGKCWCGKPKGEFDPLQHRYCCTLHANLWYFTLECYWPAFRHVICMRDRGYCQECRVQVVKFYRGEELWNDNYFHGTDLMEWDADHVLAISLGGMCFDSRNVRTLCDACHKEKTSSDIKILAWWRAETKYYDITFTFDTQRLLEIFQ